MSTNDCISLFYWQSSEDNCEEYRWARYLQALNQDEKDNPSWEISILEEEDNIGE